MSKRIQISEIKEKDEKGDPALLKWSYLKYLSNDFLKNSYIHTILIWKVFDKISKGYINYNCSYDNFCNDIQKHIASVQYCEIRR